MTDKTFEIIRLDNEKLVISMDGVFYKQKGVIITHDGESFNTYPIVNDEWKVWTRKLSGTFYVIGKEGETLLLSDLEYVLDYNSMENQRPYISVLYELEELGINISNLCENKIDVLPDTIAINLDVVHNNFRLMSHSDNYYIPVRLFYMGEDGECRVNEINKNANKEDKLVVDCLAEDVYGLVSYFKKPNLRVKIQAYYYNRINDSEEFSEIPEDWPAKVRSLQDDINKRIEALIEKYA